MIRVGDCVELMAGMDAGSVDAICTDPPYELGFMGKAWDRSGVTYQVATWLEAFRVLKPGGHLLAFGGTRTYHRLACAIEDAGFEIRDTICWLYGSGFPKSLDVGKAIDKAAGVEREVVGRHVQSVQARKPGNALEGSRDGSLAWQHDLTAPATEEAARWDGWGTALKPAHEPIVVARKPLAGTVASNVLEYGTGGLNIDGCRGGYEQNPRHEKGGSYATRANQSAIFGQPLDAATEPHAGGRWPANVILDEEAAGMLDEQSGELPAGTNVARGSDPARQIGGRLYAGGAGGRGHLGFGDSGGASRFFYCAKSSRAERNAGLDGFEERGTAPYNERPSGQLNAHLHGADPPPRRNHHPTVKPVSLMRWLVRLVTPPGGLVLDPFAGSGTTGIAATLEGFRFVGLERDAEYARIAEARIGWWAEHGQDALRIVADRERAELEREAVRESGQLDLLEAMP